jgi:hypothetical protein
MMAGGIVMVSIAPVALLAALVASSQQQSCESPNYYFDGSGSDHTNCGAYDKTIYGGAIVGLALVAAGIPMIVIGGRRDRAGAEARIRPWGSPQAAGLDFQLDL